MKKYSHIYRSKNAIMDGDTDTYIAVYDTVEQAEAVLNNIHDAIHRGDKLYVMPVGRPAVVLGRATP